MNHNSPGFAPLKTDVEDFLEILISEGKSPRTITSYRYVLNLWLSKVNIQISKEFSSRDLSKYLAWLRTEYKPKRFNGDDHPISNKTLRNHWIVLKSFFRWVSNEYNCPNPMDNVPGPKYQKKPIDPVSLEEIKALLKVCKFSSEAKTNERRSFRMHRPTALRDEVIIKVLLDTGIRASELIALKLGDLDLNKSVIHIRHGALGGAKGGKGRFVYISRGTKRSIRKYLEHRESKQGELEDDSPLFPNKNTNRPLHRDGLRLLIVSLSKRANIRHITPHAFRHTFSIQYLRNGGDVFTLQKLLGHSSLDMVQHYARVSEVDLENAHRIASPVEKWKL